MAGKSKRQKLEEKATELNLPFDENTTDEELESLVEANSGAGQQDESKVIRLVATGQVIGGPEKGYVREFSEAVHGKEWKEAAKAWKERYC